MRTVESFLYGRFEVRFKASAGSGQTSTFFTYNDIDPMTHWNEIDIEILGRYTHDVQFNVITPKMGNNHVRHQFVDFDPTRDFHTYAIEWTPDYIAWFIDHLEVYRQTDAHISTMIKPQKIMMNIYNPQWEGWVGPWDARILPKFAFYDYVSYASYTPGTGYIGTGNHFTLQWKDEFDSWDQSRWEKATHTFAGNGSDFLPENIVFCDGTMILCLTDQDNTGYVDNLPPHILSARAQANQVWVVFSETLDPASAESIANYAIPTVTLQSAQLLDNKSTVLLSTAGLAPGGNYSLVVSGICDTSPRKNRQFAQMVNIAMPQPLNFPVKINVGGGATDEFLSDQPWSENVAYGYQDGQAAGVAPSQAICNTDTPEIYQSERYGLVTYQIRVPSGRYSLELMMAENYFDQPGSRIFDIFVEGNLVCRHLDLYSAVGKNSACCVAVPDLEIKDEILDIHFSSIKNYPLVNGIVVKELETRVLKTDVSKPSGYITLSNYPNPFNSSTLIQYDIPQSGSVKIEIYDLRGQKIQTLVQSSQAAGNYAVRFDSGNLPSGIYFCHLLINSFSRTIRLALVR
ncbi:family 16 glycosylhydrolase [candidate division KSB1 bacterium]|nr:family 16 glycosylhydrolase [candidate division KSB1 bacterium]